MKKQLSIIVLPVIAMLLITGCWQTKTIVRPEVENTPPQQVVQAAPGSIWRGESDKNMLFADKKARYVNDIVTIIIAEAAQGGNKASTGTSRDSTQAASIDAFFGVENSIINSNANMGGKIAIGGKSTNALKGQGDTTRNNSLVGRISARVIRVMDNGNLMIEGRRQVTINAEDQYLIIGGIIRPQDITAENTITSQYISDARIVYTGEGVINDKMRPGWMTRIVDWVWPF
ncbi:MAG: flagellar basal body L-ring protein FlgH [Deltaproteobacteria bacterium]